MFFYPDQLGLLAEILVGKTKKCYRGPKSNMETK